jgi:hypothetical protein
LKISQWGRGEEGGEEFSFLSVSLLLRGRNKLKQLSHAAVLEVVLTGGVHSAHRLQTTLLYSVGSKEKKTE